MTRRDDMLVDLFRSSGSLLLRGVSVRTPELPRSRWGMTLLRCEAQRDPRVRKAYEAALARTAETEQTRQLTPQVLRRACGEILDIR